MKLKKAKPSFLVSAICVLVMSTLLAWALASSGGSTKIKRVSICGENGNTVSYTAWVPKNATNATPVPAIILFPGRSSNGHQLDSWSVEFARRGYVVVNVDWNGNGETEVLTTQEAYVEGVMDSVLQMPFVNTDELIVLGNSAGNRAATLACELYSDNVKVYINDVHPTLLADLPEGTNTLLIQARADQYVNAFVGDEAAVKAKLTEAWGLDETVVEKKMYGSAEDGTIRQYVITDTIHQVSALDIAGITASIEFVNAIFPAPVSIPAGSHILAVYEIFQILGYAGIIVFILALGNALYTHIPYFNVIGNTPTENKGLRGKALTRNVVIALLIPLVIFFPISWFFHNLEIANGIFQSRNLRGIIGWLVTSAVITLCLLAINAQKAKKAGAVLLPSNYALCGEGEKVEAYKIGRAFLLAVITVSSCYAWIRFVETAFGINYQIWNVLNISEITPKRLLASIPFVLCTIVIMLASNIGMNTSRRLVETGNPQKDMFRQVVLNVSVSAGVVTGLLLVQYGIGWATGHYIMPQLQNVGGGGTSSGSLDFAFGFPLIMGFSAGMSTYFYKKTNNIWIGTFISAIFGGLVGVASSTFILPTAVM